MEELAIFGRHAAVGAYVLLVRLPSPLDQTLGVTLELFGRLVQRFAERGQFAEARADASLFLRLIPRGAYQFRDRFLIRLETGALKRGGGNEYNTLARYTNVGRHGWLHGFEVWARYVIHARPLPR